MLSPEFLVTYGCLDALDNRILFARVAVKQLCSVKTFFSIGRIGSHRASELSTTAAAMRTHLTEKPIRHQREHCKGRDNRKNV